VSFRYSYKDFLRLLLYLPDQARKWMDFIVRLLRPIDVHRNYDRIFGWALFISICFHLLSPLFLVKTEPDTSDIKDLKELLSLEPRSLVVINAVPRSSVVKQMVRVPRISEVDVVQDTVVVPKIELSALNIGADLSSGSGSGSAGGGGGGSGEGSPSGTAYSRRPELMMLVPPVYPREAEKNRIEGSVELRIHVTDLGTVDQVEVTSSSGIPSMDEAAVKAALKTRFRPAIKNGQRIPMWINYPIQFALGRK
jgi:TonB family protein